MYTRGTATALYSHRSGTTLQRVPAIASGQQLIRLPATHRVVEYIHSSGPLESRRDILIYTAVLAAQRIYTL